MATRADERRSAHQAMVAAGNAADGALTALVAALGDLDYDTLPTIEEVDRRYRDLVGTVSAYRGANGRYILALSHEKEQS